MASRRDPQRANQTDPSAMNSLHRQSETSSSTWWCGAVSSETELLSAAVLCAAIAANSRANADANATDVTTAAERDASRRELEAFIRSSPLPHKLQLPVIEFTSKYIVIESAHSVICAVRATHTSDIVEAVLGSTVPLSQPYVYRYGGARIHLPFWKRAQQLELGALYSHARVRTKTLLLCGHSIAGSIAQLALCELVYQQLPLSARQALEKKDAEARKKDLRRNHQSSSSVTDDGRHDGDDDVWQALARDETLHATLPHVMVMGFGSPYISSHALQRFLNALQLTKRVVTLVNELDCIPGILNVAQSAAMLTKTTERFLTITKATKTLMKLLPAQMQSVFVGLGTNSHPAHVGNVTSAYISMSLHILQNTFHKFRELNVIKELDYQYAPCGTYLFLKKDSKEFKLLSEASAVLRELQDDDAATTTLTGNSILQHLMSAYVDAIARRSTSIQINESMNYYERLGVSRQATPRQIRSAYKSLALKWHPDRWSSAVNPREKDMAEQVFKLLAESYEVLSDAEARAAYDTHLSRGPSWAEEFVRQGTVRGMTLDEAIATFRDVLDGATGAVSQVTSRFTSSSSSVVGQSRIQRVDPLLATAKTNNGLVANNHNNMFAPDRIRVARRVGVGAEQQERIIFVQPDEILPGDIAAPAMANQNGRPGVPGMRTVSVLGGAVVVGASVALAVTAWNQYSESAKRDMQATAVRKMPGEYLLLLMDDHRTHHGVKPRKTTQVIEAGKPSSTDTGERTLQTEATLQEETQTALEVRRPTSEEMVATAGAAEQEVDEDDALVDEFFECLTEYEEARLEAFAEDEFFDCVDLAEQVAMHFKLSIEPASTTDPCPSESDPTNGPTEDDAETLEFPVGSAVLTPFGLGTLEDWRPALTSAVVRFDASCVGFIQKKDISRGAARALTSALTIMETKRTALSERVVVRLGLDKSQQPSTVRGLVQAGKDGAIDSGLRAAGGVMIAKGMARASTRLGGAVAAPLTIASILVDIGKDYYDYRQKQTERKNMGVLSTTSERLMMRDFRLKAGQHIASGTAAAAGASLGAYSVASAVGFWTGVGITGPIGVVAATGAAVVGGMLGFFAGSKAYDGYTAGYFTSYKTAKEQIDRLELGARILFNEYDPRGSGEISKTDCIQLISKLYEASGAVSESGYQGVLTVIQDDRFEGPVAWPVFWEWVSTEAARSLRKLEEDDAQKNHEAVDVERESWWRSYVSYFSYANSALPPTSTPTFVATADAALYPTVQALFKFNGTQPAAQEQDSVAIAGADTGRLHASELVILRAQIEYLVNAGSLTGSDAFQLEQLLESEDDALRQSAQKTIAALHEGELDAAATNTLAEGGGGGGIISDGFVGACDGDGDVSSSNTPHRVVPLRRERTLSQDQVQMDVLCSLLSTDGLHQYLHSQHIEVTPETAARHDALHCLALQAATPPAASAASI